MSDHTLRDSTPDKRWCDQLVLELRLRDVDGAAIGDALAQVEAHCAESGETPQDAFGDPAAYADALALPVPADDFRGTVRAVASGLAATLAVTLALRAAVGIVRGAEPSITVGDAAAAGAILVSTAVFVAFLRPLLSAQWRFVVWFTLTFTVVVGLGVVLRAPLFPVSVPLAFGLAAVAAVVAVGLFRSLGSDPIRDPRRP